MRGKTAQTLPQTQTFAKKKIIWGNSRHQESLPMHTHTSTGTEQTRKGRPLEFSIRQVPGEATLLSPLLFSDILQLRDFTASCWALGQAFCHELLSSQVSLISEYNILLKFGLKCEAVEWFLMAFILYVLTHWLYTLRLLWSKHSRCWVTLEGFRCFLLPHVF